MSTATDHYEKLIRMYSTAPVNRPLEPVMTIGEGTAEVTMNSTRSHHHAAGAVHGAYYFKMLDDAAFFAASSLIDDGLVLTASFTVEMFRPVVEGPLRAVGTVSKPGRNVLFATAELFDVDDRLLGRGSGVFARSQIPLDATIGYE